MLQRLVVARQLRGIVGKQADKGHYSNFPRVKSSLAGIIKWLAGRKKSWGATPVKKRVRDDIRDERQTASQLDRMIAVYFGALRLRYRSGSDQVRSKSFPLWESATALGVENVSARWHKSAYSDILHLRKLVDDDVDNVDDDDDAGDCAGSPRRVDVCEQYHGDVVILMESSVVARRVHPESERHAPMTLMRFASRTAGTSDRPN